MTFDFFIEANKVIQKYADEVCAEKLEKSVAERRELLKAEKYEEFHRFALDTTNWETEVKMNISNRLYHTLKIDKKVQEKS